MKIHTAQQYPYIPVLFGNKRHASSNNDDVPQKSFPRITYLWFSEKVQKNYQTRNYDYIDLQFTW